MNNKHLLHDGEGDTKIISPKKNHIFEGITRGKFDIPKIINLHIS